MKGGDIHMTAEQGPRQPEEIKPTPQKLFELGRKVAKRGEKTNDENRRREEFVFIGRVGDKKYRLTHTQYSNDEEGQGSNSRWYRNSNAEIFSNREHVEIEGRDINATLSYGQWLNLQSGERRPEHNATVRYNDNDTDIEDLLGKMVPDRRESSPGKRMVAQKGFAIYENDHGYSCPVGVTIVAETKEEAKEKYLDDREAEGDYHTILSIKKGWYSFESQTLVFSESTLKQKGE
jgi:hypothetical protein